MGPISTYHEPFTIFRYLNHTIFSLQQLTENSIDMNFPWFNAQRPQKSRTSHLKFKFESTCSLISLHHEWALSTCKQGFYKGKAQKIHSF